MRAQEKKCQLHSLPKLTEPMGFFEKVWQRRNRLKRALKRRCWYILNSNSSNKDNQDPRAYALASRRLISKLEAGDLVRIRSTDEIKATLDRWNQFRRCAFMEEMWQYCGTEQRVLKKIEKFLDERDYLLKRCNGIVILNGVICEGTIDFGECDRSCYFFWREEWLEKIE